MPSDIPFLIRKACRRLLKWNVFLSLEKIVIAPYAKSAHYLMSFLIVCYCCRCSGVCVCVCHFICSGRKSTANIVKKAQRLTLSATCIFLLWSDLGTTDGPCCFQLIILCKIRWSWLSLVLLSNSIRSNQL
jgi:hypothetical protein